MTTAAHEAYLETQILTATPQKLRLLLIDGALRFGRQALECWDDESALTHRYAALDRCNDIITELYTTIRDDDSDVLHRVKDIYRFLLMQMGEASRSSDTRVLRQVLEVLEAERETWRQLCEQMPHAPVRNDNAAAATQDVTAAGLGVIGPGLSDASGPATTQSLSLEA